MTKLEPQPPEPPSIAPKLRFHRIELAGVATLAILPLAALAGLFGPASQETRARIGAVEVVASAPSRLRHEMSDRITVTISNKGSQPVKDLWVAFDPAYVHAFSGVSFSPDPDRPYVVRLASLQSGEQRLIGIEVRADEYGLHRGDITVGTGGETARARVETLILP